MPRRHTHGSLRPSREGLNPERSYPENRALFEKVEILFLLAAVLGCVVTLLHVALVVPLPYMLDFGEGPFLGVAVRVAQGLSAYPPATQLPYVISPYGPLPYYLAGLCVKLFGVSFTAPKLLDNDLRELGSITLVNAEGNKRNLTDSEMRELLTTYRLNLLWK